LLTIEDLVAPKNRSGYRHVLLGSTTSHSPRKRPYQAYKRLPNLNGRNHFWYGPWRATAEEAAQDYCDYINGLPAATPATLKTAGHTSAPRADQSNPKMQEALALMREAKAEDDPAGYVYLIAEVDCDEFGKIGKSKHEPRYRLGGLQSGNRRPLRVRAFIETDDRHSLEALLHAKYAHLNTLNEWFEIDSAILAEFGIDVNPPAAVQQAA
jgi:hypothetical protein